MGRKLTPKEIEEYKSIREQRTKKVSECLDIPIDRLEAIRKKALESVIADDSWEKELDERNKKKAGIE